MSDFSASAVLLAWTTIAGCCLGSGSGGPPGHVKDVASLEAYFAASRAHLVADLEMMRGICREHRSANEAELNNIVATERVLIAATDRGSRASSRSVWRKVFVVGRPASRLAEAMLPLEERCRLRQADLATAERELAPLRAAYDEAVRTARRDLGLPDTVVPLP